LSAPAFEQNSPVVDYAEVPKFMIGKATLGLSEFFFVERLGEDKSDLFLHGPSPLLGLRRHRASCDKQSRDEDRE
jgi:hypothetical protein